MKRARYFYCILLLFIFIFTGCVQKKGTSLGEHDTNTNGISTEPITTGTEIEHPSFPDEYFSRVELGMSWWDLEEIFGYPGIALGSGVTSIGYCRDSGEWVYMRLSPEYDPPGVSGFICYDSGYDLSLFKNVNIGMTFDEVKNIINSDCEPLPVDEHLFVYYGTYPNGEKSSASVLYKFNAQTSVYEVTQVTIK